MSRTEYNKCSQGWKAGKCHLGKGHMYEVPESNSSAPGLSRSVFICRKRRENTQYPASSNALVPQGHQLHSVAVWPVKPHEPCFLPQWKNSNLDPLGPEKQKAGGVTKGHCLAKQFQEKCACAGYRWTGKVYTGWVLSSLPEMQFVSLTACHLLSTRFIELEEHGRHV